MMVDESAEKAIGEIREMLFDLLTERFKDELEFGPIVVIPSYDHEGMEYLFSYIVFHGDRKKLDPAWTLGLSHHLWNRAEELGYPGVPIHMFVAPSEWPAMKKWIRREWPDMEKWLA